MLGIPAGMAITGLIKHDKQLIRNACVNITSTVICSGITAAMKYSINRDRPFVTYPDIVNKSPAATIENLAESIKQLFSPNHEINIIGTRHGEKLYETLCTREEMLKSEDMGNFFRIPSDNRDLNYNRYFSEGENKIAFIDDYNSSNTQQLDIQGIINLLNSIDLKNN